MKRRQKQNLELFLALENERRRSVRNYILPARQKDPNRYEPFQEARDHLLTLYEPDKVQDILNDMSPTQIEVTNIYWTDIKKKLVNLNNPTKSIILKIVNLFG